MKEEEISKEVVDAALAIHRALGPGLLESAYVTALEIECGQRGLEFAREVAINASYLGRPLGVVYRADLVINDLVLVEVKAVQGIDPIHRAQVLSYLRFGRWKLGLLLNFHSQFMKNGISRIANDL